MRLSKEDSWETGRYSTARAPYQKEIIDECTNRDNRTVVFISGAQNGKSLILKIVTGYSIHQEPVPMLVVHPTLSMGKTYSQDRLDSMFRDVKVLRDLVGDTKTRDSGNTILQKRYPGGDIAIAGANSPASLASRSRGKVLFDEVDKYKESAGGQGDPCAQGEARLETYPDGMSIYTSTPTNEGDSKIFEKYEQTDQRKYFVPCPHCGHEHLLLWDNMVWKEDSRGKVVPASVHMLCPSCLKPIQQSHKITFIAKGVWKPTAEPLRPGFVGFWINSLYSPFKTWLDRVYEFVEARKVPELLQVFYNAVLAKLWKIYTESPDWEKVYSKREKYPFNRIPAGASIILGGVDIQGDRLEVLIRAYGPNMESWGIDHRVLIGSPKKKMVWSKLDKIMEEEFPYEIGGSAKIYRLAIDTGYESTIAMNWAGKYGYDRVMAIKGSSMRMAPRMGTPKLMDKDSQGKKLVCGTYLTMIGTNAYKTDIYSALKLDRVKPGHEVPWGYRHYPEFSEDFFKQLTVEGLVKRAGRFYWDKPAGAANEGLDLEVYSDSAAYGVGVYRWTNEKHEAYIQAWVKGPDPKEVKKAVKRGPPRRSSLYD